MAYRSSWVGVEDRVLEADLGAFVPEPVTAAEAAEVAAVFAEQDASLGPEHDPDSVEYWARLEDMTGGLAEVEPAGLAAQELAGGLATAARGLGRATLGQEELVGVLDADLVESLETVGRARTQLDATA